MIPVIDLEKHQIDVEAMAKIPRDFLENHEVIPLAVEKGKILLAMVRSINLEILEEIQFMTNCLIETALAPREQILKAIKEYYSLSPYERRVRVREAPKAVVKKAPQRVPQSPHLAEALAEILIERGLVTREEIDARLKTREL